MPQLPCGSLDRVTTVLVTYQTPDRTGALGLPGMGILGLNGTKSPWSTGPMMVIPSNGLFRYQFLLKMDRELLYFFCFRPFEAPRIV